MSSLNLDPRIVKVGVIVGDNIDWYEHLNIELKGIKLSNSVSAQCEITILNIDKAMREYILRETNPLTNRGKNIQIIAEVGRESYGTSTFYTGDVFRSNPTPKPSIGVVLTCIQGYFNKAKIVSRSAKTVTKLSAIAQIVASDNDCNLSFEIKDTNITSYSYTGSASGELLQLSALSMSQVYIDNKTMYVKEEGVAAKGSPVLQLSNDSGLLKADGTEYGCKVEFLYNPTATIGGQVDLISEINPSLDGSYTIRKLPFHISSRSQPFYYGAELDKIR